MYPSTITMVLALHATPSSQMIRPCWISRYEKERMNPVSMIFVCEGVAFGEMSMVEVDIPRGCLVCTCI